MNIKYISEKALARRWSVSPRTVQTWRQQNDNFLPFIKFGKSVRYAIEDIENYESTGSRQSICGVQR